MKKKRILNIGCGTETYGTHFIDKYPSRKEVIKCDIDSEKLPFPNNTFDEVYSKNLLEHLRNPNTAIGKMVRVLKKGGRLIIITDNAGYLFHHLDLSGISSERASHQESEGLIKMGKEDKHFSLFTPLHLIHHFKEFGVKNIKVRYKFNRSYTWKNNILYFFCNVLFNSYFKPIAYPLIEIEARK
jgi:SAM-dependent methyltransferase